MVVISLTLLNYGSNENYELLKPIAGGLLVSLFFVISSLFSPIEIKQYTIPIVILSRQDIATKQERFLSFPYFAAFDDPGYGYSDISSLAAQLGAKGVEIIPVKDRQYLTELLELESILWVASQYPTHWQVQREWFNGFSGGGGSMKIMPDADKEKVELGIADLLKSNLYVAKVKDDYFNRYIYLPKGMRATYNQKLHSIEFDNNRVNIKIRFTNVGGSTLGAGYLSQKLKADLQEDAYGKIWVGHFTANFMITPKMLTRWSPDTKKQIAWANELATNYDKAFSFYIVKQLIEEN
ncbi:MAG: hypothetical protein WC330_05780 [Candidatus Omnitrophota bacterium]